MKSTQLEEGRDAYVESLAGDLYWAAERWLRRVDPYRYQSPLWRSLREERKEPYREMAKQAIEVDKQAQQTMQSAMHPT